MSIQHNGAAIPRKWEMVFLAAVLIVAAVLRIHQLGTQSFWLDELLSLEASASHGQTDQALPRDMMIAPARLTSLNGAPPWWKVWTTIQKDSHPPLYYIFLRGWRGVFGDGEAAVRMLSVVWSLAAVVLIYFVGRRIVGFRGALCAALLLAVMPLQVLFAQEARNYSMLVATTLLAAWAMLRVEERLTVGRVAVFSAALLMAMLTHYLAAPVLLMLAIYAGVSFRGRAFFGVGVAFVVAAVVFVGVWGPLFLQQRDSFRRNAAVGPEAAAQSGLVVTLVRAGGDPLRQLGGARVESGIVAVIVALALVGACFLVRRNRRLLIPLLWIVLPLAFLMVTDLRTHTATLTLARYTYVTSPGVVLLLTALFTMKVPGPVRVLPVLLSAGYCVYSLPAVYRPWKPDWRSLAAALDRSSGPDDVIVLGCPVESDWWLGGAVLGVTHYSQRDPVRFVLLTGPASPSTAGRLAHGWMIVNSMDAAALLPGARVVPVGSGSGAGAVYHFDGARR